MREAEVNSKSHNPCFGLRWGTGVVCFGSVKIHDPMEFITDTKSVLLVVRSFLIPTGILCFTVTAQSVLLYMFKIII